MNPVVTVAPAPHDAEPGATVTRPPYREGVAPALHAPVPVYGLDIETDTSVDGLDPTRGGVVAVALSGPTGELVLDGDEATMLARLDQWLADAPSGVVATWNGARFDLPYLAARADILGVPLGLRLRIDVRAAACRPGDGATYLATWYHHRHLDGYRLYRADVGRLYGWSCSLKTVARLAGLHPVEVDASAVHLLGADTLRTYVASDARCTRLLVLGRGIAALDSADPLR